MDDLIEQVTRGNVTEVKVVLASIIVALAVYQVFLMAIGYGKLVVSERMDLVGGRLPLARMKRARMR